MRIGLCGGMQADGVDGELKTLERFRPRSTDGAPQRRMRRPWLCKGQGAGTALAGAEAVEFQLRGDCPSHN